MRFGCQDILYGVVTSSYTCFEPSFDFLSRLLFTLSASNAVMVSPKLLVTNILVLNALHYGTMKAAEDPKKQHLPVSGCKSRVQYASKAVCPILKLDQRLRFDFIRRCNRDQSSDYCKKRLVEFRATIYRNLRIYRKGDKGMLKSIVISEAFGLAKTSNACNPLRMIKEYVRSRQPKVIYDAKISCSDAVILFFIVDDAANDCSIQ